MSIRLLKFPLPSGITSALWAGLELCFTVQMSESVGDDVILVDEGPQEIL